MATKTRGYPCRFCYIWRSIKTFFTPGQNPFPTALLLSRRTTKSNNSTERYTRDCHNTCLLKEKKIERNFWQKQNQSFPIHPSMKPQKLSWTSIIAAILTTATIRIWGKYSIQTQNNKLLISWPMTSNHFTPYYIIARLMSNYLRNMSVSKTFRNWQKRNSKNRNRYDGAWIFQIKIEGRTQTC